MDIESLIRTVPDFPKPGIGFKDITPVLSSGPALRYIVDHLAERYEGRIDTVVGIESRGFIFGAPLAYALGVGFTVVRKPGKLPAATVQVSYELEYGEDTLEMHVDALDPGSRVLLVDDLLATGGTAKAAVELLVGMRAEIVSCAFLVELGFLGGGAKLKPHDYYSMIQYEDE
jgi:adenine phosphoribosyltransferase